jgi:hypothetical protein
MLLDGLVVWGLHIWEKRAKLQKELALHEESNEHEILKKTTRADKAANRNQRKAMDKKTHNKSGQTSFAPKANIIQPDKNKKSR